MKSVLQFIFIISIGFLVSCGGEETKIEIPSAEQASLKSALPKKEKEKISAEVEASPSTEVNVEKNKNDGDGKGAQNFDPNANEAFYDKDGKTIVREVAPNSAVEPKKGGVPQMSFDETHFHFGEVEDGELVKHTFNFTNTGTGDLVIADATASCGCTTPSFSFMPIKPNETSTIEVTFNSANREGVQSKVITITTNAYPRVRKVFIEGKVLPKGSKASKPASEGDTTKH